MENKDNAVSVTYNPDCEFVIATVNAQSGVRNVTTGSISDVKKQSNTLWRVCRHKSFQCNKGCHKPLGIEV